MQTEKRDSAVDGFTSYNARLGDLLKKARERVNDSSSVMPLPDYKPAKTDSYAARLKSQIRRLNERVSQPRPARNCGESSEVTSAEDCIERGFTD